MIDKEYKRRVFDRHATTYDQYASLQNKISDNLFKKLDLIELRPNLILDLGCGTGRNGRIMKEKYKNMRLINYDFSVNMLREAKKKQHKILDNECAFVCGDIEELSFSENTFDVIWSTSSLQWCNNLSDIFKKVQLTLKPGGLFIFSTFGPNTLYELKSITKKISNYQKTNTFLDIFSIEDMLINEGFGDQVIDSEEFCLTYKDINKLLLDIRKIGATSGFKSKKTGLSGKNFLKLILDGYKKYSYDGIFPATYEVVYGYAWNTHDK